MTATVGKIASGTKTIVSNTTGELPKTKAEKRSHGLAAWRASDDKAKAACDDRKALKDSVLDLCDDGKTYKDINGHTYTIDKETVGTDYSGTLKWALASTNPLELTPKQLRDLKKKLDGTKKPKPVAAPIKRND